MDLDYLSFLFVFMISLLGTARFSDAETLECRCPEVPRKTLTQLPQESCFQENSRFRYTCVEGYVRKAGTSTLIKCIKNGSDFQWTSGSLQCIPDPKRPSPPRSKDGVKTSRQPESTTISAHLFTTWSLFPSVTPIGKREVMLESKAISTHLFTTWSLVTSVSPIGKREVMLESKGILAVGLCLPPVVICAVIVLSCLLYRRWKRRTIPPHTPDEMVQMNVSSGLSA